MNFLLATLCVAAYVVGSLPFGVWLARANGVDLRKSGSGNIGATNVIRVLGWKVGLPVFLLDVAKGFAPALVAGVATTPDFSNERALLVGTFAVIGHSASLFLNFRGGKSVATALGVMFAATPGVALVSLGAFAVLLVVTGYVSLGSIAGALCAPIFAALFGYSLQIVLAYSLLALFLVFKHAGNLNRLRRGEESRFLRKR